MRRISFSMTKEQFLDGSKTVTRRIGWKGLDQGDRLLAVEKCMKKGERQVELGEIEVVDVGTEVLSAITSEDIVAEGFPEMSRGEFVDMFCHAMKCRPWDVVTRIEFRRVQP